MKREIYDCDRCGEACDLPVSVPPIVVGYEETSGSANDLRIVVNLDFCGACAGAVIERLAVAAYLEHERLKWAQGLVENAQRRANR